MTAKELFNKYSKWYVAHADIPLMNFNDFNEALGEILSLPVELPVSQENGGQWQTCPKCNGQGCVSRPPWIPGDIVEWAGTTATYPCNVCNGKMIIKY